MKTILITGGAGFIGSHVVRLFVNKYPNYQIVNLDKLTYAGNLANLKDIEDKPNYEFVKGDIVDADFIQNLFEEKHFDGVIHLAAESHVDRSIANPTEFVFTNVIGTVNLLNAAKFIWKDNNEGKLFYHISTDEVYGSLGEDGMFTEETGYDPHSPYSASKASSDHFVRAYCDTFGLPAVVSNCSNNYGSYQFPEKLIPLFINNIKNNKPLPVYGKGINIRDWLWVEDHARAIDVIFHNGLIGETYNIGGHNEWKNIDLIKVMCSIMDRKLGREQGTSEKLITYVTDRAGHDLRYAIDSTKLQKELGWVPSLQFEEGLEKTIDWYLENTEWLENVTSGDYQQYYEKMYKNRQLKLDDLLIITPIKDSIETAKEAISKICASKGDFSYLVYNDYSMPETKKILEADSVKGYELINIEELVQTPSPNYRFTLQDSRKKAIESGAGLLIVESDVFVEPTTISKMVEFAQKTADCGMVAAITVDKAGEINFPYKHIEPDGSEAIVTNHRLSFCCTLLTLPLLKQLDFDSLSEKKDWFDVQISRNSRNLGFNNYVLPNVRVQHLPHSSRPWKKLKYTNPVKYYLRKWFLGKDRI